VIVPAPEGSVRTNLQLTVPETGSVARIETLKIDGSCANGCEANLVNWLRLLRFKKVTCSVELARGQYLRPGGEKP
jgi:hypothetical protein